MRTRREKEGLFSRRKKERSSSHLRLSVLLWKAYARANSEPWKKSSAAANTRRGNIGTGSTVGAEAVGVDPPIVVKPLSFFKG